MFLLKKFYNQWQKKRLLHQEYGFLFDPPAYPGVVSIDCETTGLDPKKDEIITIAAIRIVDNQILASESISLTLRPSQPISGASIKIHQMRNCDVVDGLSPIEAMQHLLHFIGSSPLLGYYLAFDVALINRIIKPWLGIHLPNPLIELSALYYDKKIGLIPQKHIDLRFDRILNELAIPPLAAHNAHNDALMVAMAYLKLTKAINLKLD